MILRVHYIFKIFFISIGLFVFNTVGCSSSPANIDSDSSLENENCYDLSFLAPPFWGTVISEENDDADKKVKGIQYLVVVDPDTPVSDTQICLYSDRKKDSDPIECIEPDTGNPISFDVTLLQGNHLLEVEIEPLSSDKQFDCSPVQTAVEVWEYPSCNITWPNNLSTDRDKPTVWNDDTMDITVTTSGSDVDLWVSGLNMGNANAASKVASFKDVDLGKDRDGIQIRIVCNNRGSSTGSTAVSYYISKDSEGPDVQILSPKDGTRFGEEECPFTMTVKGVEKGQEVCASFGTKPKQTKPLKEGCAFSKDGVDEEIELLVDCVNSEGEALSYIAWSADSQENMGTDTVDIIADTDVPAVVIQNPQNAAVYNKSDDTINDVTDAFENIIVVCTDAEYNLADVTLMVDSIKVTNLNPTIGAATCNGLPYKLTFQTPYAFSQAGSGLQTSHTVDVSISDGKNAGSESSTFTNDTIAPTLSILDPDEPFYTSNDDWCVSTPDFEVYNRVRANGLEIGENVTISVWNGGSQVGSDYLKASTNESTCYLVIGTSCDSGTKYGVELAEGMNTIRANATDAAGNSAEEVEKRVAYGNGFISFPEDQDLLGASDDCDGNLGNSTFGIPVHIQVNGDAVKDGTEITVTISSAHGGWSYDDTWLSDCSIQGIDCIYEGFCFVMDADDAEQNDIAASMEIGSELISGGPTGIRVDLSPPDAPVTLPISVDPAYRRAAQVDLSWNGMIDQQSGALKAWDVRCVKNELISDSNWDTAIDFEGEPTPPATLGIETMSIAEYDSGGGVMRKIRAGETWSCGIRAESQSDLSSPVAIFGDDNSSPADGDWSDPEDDNYIDYDDIGFLEYTTVITGYSKVDYENMIFANIFPAGDVNGDGYDDLLVGYGGNVALYMGSSNGPTTPTAITCSDASFGTGMAGIGDFDGVVYNAKDPDNNKRFADFAIGAADQKKVYIFRGHKDMGGAPLSCDDADIRVVSDSVDFGRVVAAAGDFDGDGKKDLAVGCPRSNSWDGETNVIFGRNYAGYSPQKEINLSSGLNVTGDLRIKAEAGSWSLAGSSIASWNLDQDADDRSDLVVGAPWGGVNYHGEAQILYGRKVTKTAGSMNEIEYSSLDIVIDSPANGDNYEELALSGVTPIDFDGQNGVDLAIGAHAAKEGGVAGEGDVFIYLNDGTGGFTSNYDHYLAGSSINDALGGPVAGNYNQTRVVQGSDDAPIAWRLNGLVSSATDQAVFAGAAQHDLGYNPYTSTGLGYAGLWYAGFAGNVTTNDADIIFSQTIGVNKFHWCAFVGDLNGDGYVDLAVADTQDIDLAGDTSDKIIMYY